MLIMVLYGICFFLYNRHTKQTRSWFWCYQLDNNEKSYPVVLIDNYPVLPMTTKIDSETKLIVNSITFNSDLTEEEIKKLELTMYLYYTDGSKSTETEISEIQVSDFDLIKSSGKFTKDQYVVVPNKEISIGTNENSRNSKAFFVSIQTKEGLTDKQPEAIVDFTIS